LVAPFGYRARALAFTEITARGLDVAEARIRRARVQARDPARLHNMQLTLDVADPSEGLPEIQ
jgi:hypothetical protein